MSYMFLAGAILFEVIGTLLLPVTQNFTRAIPTMIMITCYAVAFYCLTFAIRDIPIAIVYAIWSGIGVFLISKMAARLAQLACKSQRGFHSNVENPPNSRRFDLAYLVSIS